MEMKKSYSPFGSTPLSVDEVLPDIQTGRAVYPDKDKEADASYMERINQYKHEGFHDVSEDGGSSGGDSSSGGGSAGYECKEETTLLTDESVTTKESPLGVGGAFSYPDVINADKIKVTFNGEEYVLDVERTESERGVVYRYGGLSEYPFMITSAGLGGRNRLNTPNIGTYQVKIESLVETIEASECFKKAVESVMSAIPTGGTLVVRVDHTEGSGLNQNIIFDKTWNEVKNALANGTRVIVVTADDVPIEAAQQTVIYRAMGAESAITAEGVSALNGSVQLRTYYACSKDGYLQTQECVEGK